LHRLRRANGDFKHMLALLEANIVGEPDPPGSNDEGASAAAAAAAANAGAQGPPALEELMTLAVQVWREACVFAGCASLLDVA
jgi:hypothetical protein